MSSKKTQKIIIPKGAVDPSDTTVIEVPYSLHKEPVVIAKRKSDTTSTSKSEVYLSLSQSAAAARGGRPDQSYQKQKAQDVSTSFNQSLHKNFGTHPPFGNDTTIYHDARPQLHMPQSSQIIADDIDDTERQEKELILTQLEEYQQARRRFLQNATFVTNKSTGTTNAVSASTTATIVPPSNIQIRQEPLRTPTYSGFKEDMNFNSTFYVKNKQQRTMVDHASNTEHQDQEYDKQTCPALERPVQPILKASSRNTVKSSEIQPISLKNSDTSSRNSVSFPPQNPTDQDRQAFKTSDKQTNNLIVSSIQKYSDDALKEASRASNKITEDTDSAQYPYITIKQKLKVRKGDLGTSEYSKMDRSTTTFLSPLVTVSQTKYEVSADKAVTTVVDKLDSKSEEDSKCQFNNANSYEFLVGKNPSRYKTSSSVQANSISPKTSSSSEKKIPCKICSSRQRSDRSLLNFDDIKMIKNELMETRRRLEEILIEATKSSKSLPALKKTSSRCSASCSRNSNYQTKVLYQNPVPTGISKSCCCILNSKSSCNCKKCPQ